VAREGGRLVVATLRADLDAWRCLEVFVMRGPSVRLQALADRLIGQRGVLTGEVVAAAGDEGEGAPP
jgi:metal-responsive CopG/Arc/MetJ family transcriptional regulator